jgi:hypothetical protein
MRAVWLAIVMAATLGGAAKAQEVDYQGRTGGWEISGGIRDEGNFFRCKMERPALGGPFALLSSYNVTTLGLGDAQKLPNRVRSCDRKFWRGRFRRGRLISRLSG